MATVIKSTALPPEGILGTHGEVGIMDLADRLGNIPFQRIHFDPLPGTATQEDLVRVNDSQECICELIDGTLVEKPMGRVESFLVLMLSSYIFEYLKKSPLGYMVGEAGLTEFNDSETRAPDLSFFLWKNSPNNEVGNDAIGKIIPDLVVEILSQSNSRKEMADKLELYLKSKVPLIWYIDPRQKEVAVYVGSGTPIVMNDRQILDGGNILPGLQIPLQELFASDKGPQP